ncbi:MAG: DNA polymerase III subunit gamma/tau [Terriglobales bacterium]
MAYQVLARKYRPQRFSDVIGQGHVTRTLKNAIEQQRIAHGYIFSGHRGIGKTTVARILAMALNCRSSDHPIAEPCGVCDSCTEIRAGNSVDVLEIDAATNRGIDEIRELRDAARYRPARDRYKIWILDEAHQITDAAFNALLKTLEEPPPHVIFMMATTQPEDVPQTIRSRCQHFSFHAVSFEDIVTQLRDIAAREKIQVDEDALALLAEAGDGSMRDALSIMDQAIACCGDQLTAATVRQLAGAIPSELLEEMMAAVQRGSSEDVLRLVDKIMVEGENPAHFARQMVRFLRNAVVAKVAGVGSSLLQISSDERARVGRVADMFSEEDLARFLQIMLRTHSELGYKQEQRFHLELGLLKLVHAQRLLPIEELLSASTGPKPASAPVSSREAPAAGRATQAVARERTSSSSPSPFASDSARKRSTPRSDTGTNPRSEMASAATATATALDPESSPDRPTSASTILAEVIGALEDAGFQSLADMLGKGGSKLAGGELVIEVAESKTLVDMALGPEPTRVLTSTASRAANRPLRVRVVPTANGGTNHDAPLNGARERTGSAGSARARAAQEPVIRRMQEKFGAEIRSVLDYKDKR